MQWLLKEEEQILWKRRSILNNNPRKWETTSRERNTGRSIIYSTSAVAHQHEEVAKVLTCWEVLLHLTPFLDVMRR
jgi:hypothetical protein